VNIEKPAPETDNVPDVINEPDKDEKR